MQKTFKVKKYYKNQRGKTALKLCTELGKLLIALGGTANGIEKEKIKETQKLVKFSAPERKKLENLLQKIF